MPYGIEIKLSRADQLAALMGEPGGRYSEVARLIEQRFHIPQDAVMDTIRRRLMMDFGVGRHSILGVAFSPVSLMRGLAAWLWLCAETIWGLVANHQPDRHEADVMLEYWGADNYPFYRPVLEKLPAMRIGIFSQRFLAHDPAGIDKIAEAVTRAVKESH